jgi:hypothetical protein
VPREPHHSPDATGDGPVAAVAHLPRPPDLFSTDTRAEPSPPIVLSADEPAPADDQRLLETMATATEAMEYVERARGHLITLHHLLGRAEVLFEEVASELRAEGHAAEATRLEHEVIGRDVIEGRWSYELLEEFDRGYFEPVRNTHRDVVASTVGRPHAREERVRAARRRAGWAARRRSG